MQGTLMGVGSKEEPQIVEESCSRNKKQELIALSSPALAGQAIEPMAPLMETAYIDRIGLLLLLWLRVLQRNPEANGNGFRAITKRLQLASVSLSLRLEVGIGILEVLALYFGSGVFLTLMGVKSSASF